MQYIVIGSDTSLKRFKAAVEDALRAGTTGSILKEVTKQNGTLARLVVELPPDELSRLGCSTEDLTIQEDNPMRLL